MVRHTFKKIFLFDCHEVTIEPTLTFGQSATVSPLFFSTVITLVAVPQRELVYCHPQKDSIFLFVSHFPMSLSHQNYESLQSESKLFKFFSYSSN